MNPWPGSPLAHHASLDHFSPHCGTDANPIELQCEPADRRETSSLHPPAVDPKTERHNVDIRFERHIIVPGNGEALILDLEMAPVYVRVKKAKFLVSCSEADRGFAFRDRRSPLRRANAGGSVMRSDLHVVGVVRFIREFLPASGAGSSSGRSIKAGIILCEVAHRGCVDGRHFVRQWTTTDGRRLMSRSTTVRYLSAVAAVGLMVLLRFELGVLVGQRMPFVCFYFAVIFAAWYGGLGPSFLALVLAVFAATFLFVPPTYSLRLDSAVDLIGLLMFVAVNCAMIFFSEAGKRARQRLEQEVIERGRAEQAERAERERYHSILASVGDGLIVTDTEGRVVSLNAVAEELAGWKSDEAIGLPLKQVFRTVHHATHRTDEMPVYQVVSGGVARKMDQTELIAKTGVSLAIEHCTAPIVDERGHRSGVVIVFRDITERKRAEAAITASEKRLKQLANTMPQIVWTASPEGSVDYYNDRWYGYTGMTPRESLTRDGWAAAVHPDDMSVLSSARHPAVDSGEVFETETRVRGRDGIYRWHLIRSVPVQDEAGKVVRRFGAATDIDSLKRTKEALIENEARLRLALTAANMGSWDWNIATGEVTWSDKLDEIHGLAPGSFDGTVEGFRKLIHPDDLGFVQETISRSIEQSIGFSSEFRIVWPDASIHWMSGKGRVVTDDNGQPTRMIGVAMDVTERKRLEEELQQRLAELAEADRRKDEFLATLAHELRNPLAPIRNALFLMKGPPNETSGNETERLMAERQVAHLTRLIDDLMDVARISQGKIELRGERVDLIEVVQRAIEGAGPSIRDKNHKLTASLPNRPTFLDADATRIEQILSNLIGNAVKYTEPGGEIELVVEQLGAEVEIRLRDNGIGITPEVLPHIFDMFVQADQGSKRTQGGLGIGLGLVRTLATMHGGSIQAISDGLGKGSEFIVRLPALEERTSHDANASSPGRMDSGTTDLHRRRVLVVDDNVDAAQSLARLLARFYNQDVRVAHDGYRAVALAEEFHPEVVVLDIGMPGMDGYEVARRLREQPGGREATIIALTGWGQETDRARSKEAGFDAHIVKPIDPEILYSYLVSQRVTT
jgi:PAS domain S-box-containing protein